MTPQSDIGQSDLDTVIGQLIELRSGLSPQELAVFDAITVRSDAEVEGFMFQSVLDTWNKAVSDARRASDPYGGRTRPSDLGPNPY